MKPRDFCNCTECNPELWKKWKDGKCLPVPGEAIGSTECLHCERILTAESDPELACPAKPSISQSPIQNKGA